MGRVAALVAGGVAAPGRGRDLSPVADSRCSLPRRRRRAVCGAGEAPLPLVSRLRRHLAARRLFPEPGLAVLAVSGGADSLALLDLMAELAPQLGLGLLVAHADHGIRPAGRAEAERVRRLARRRYGLETVVGRLGLGAGVGETRARAARYGFLRDVQGLRGARYLVTAHHADDQVETVLARVLRGSGPPGLAGIPARGPQGLVRPLLPFARADLLAHVRARRLKPTDDPSNRDPRNLRSWLRTELLPLVTARFGAEGSRALLRTARHARAERRAWDAVLDALPGLGVEVAGSGLAVAREVVGGYDKWLAERVLRAAAWRAGFALTPAVAARVARFASRSQSGRRLPLGNGLEAEVAFGRLRVFRPGAAPRACALEGPRGEIVFGGYHIGWRTARGPTRLPRSGWRTWLAPGALGCRGPRGGDRLRPLGGSGRRKVSRLLMEAKVPRGERAAFPVLTVDGVVAWLPGVCRGDTAVPERGRKAMRVDVRPR